METQQALRDFGLEEKEQKVYLGLLELGEASVRDIAHKSSLKRPTVYVVLDALEEKYCVRKIPGGKMVHYAPTPPPELAVIMRERLARVKEAIPGMQALLSVQKGAPGVALFEGAAGLERIGGEVFSIGEDIMYIGTVALSLPVFEKSYAKAHKTVYSSKQRLYELIDESEESRNYARSARDTYRHVRFIPEERLPFPADIMLCGDKVYITSVRGKLFTVRIESKDIAQAFKVMFKMLWHSAIE